MSLIACAVGWDASVRLSHMGPGLSVFNEFHRVSYFKTKFLICNYSCGLYLGTMAWTNCFAGENQTRTREVNTTALMGGDECSTSDSSGKEPCRNILWFTFLLHYNDISVQNPLLQQQILIGQFLIQ
jgi:hypothetical protein